MRPGCLICMYSLANWVIIGPGNDLAPMSFCQINLQWTYLEEIIFEIQKFSFTKIHLKISSWNHRSFCGNLLRASYEHLFSPCWAISIQHKTFFISFIILSWQTWRKRVELQGQAALINAFIEHFQRIVWEFTGHRWIPHTKASDAEIWCFLWIWMWISGWVNNRPWGWWFETPANSLWHHCNVPTPDPFY